MKRYGMVLLLAAAFWLGGSQAHGQSSRAIGIQGGLAVSNNPQLDSIVLLEFPFTVNRSQFEFFWPDSAADGYYARIFAQVTLLDTQARAVDSTNTYFSVRVRSLDAAGEPDVKVFNKLSMVAPPGLYSARLTVIDVVSKREGSILYTDINAEPPATSLAIGGPRLAYSIREVRDGTSGVNPRMVKNGLEILTNPAGILGQQDTALWVYAEVYNLDTADSNQEEYRLGFRVLDRNGAPYQDFGYVMRHKPDVNAIIVQSFDITGWEQNYYNLEISVADPASGQADTALVPFRILSDEEVSRMVSSHGGGRVDPYDSLSLQEKLNLVTYELTPDQKLTLSQLGEAGKKNFLRQYWLEHDENPSTPVNETRIELIRRYRFANENFSSSQGANDGWRSDRGRIYMTYGHWYERDDVQSPMVGEPFVIWYYRLTDEGLVFAFADETGHGDYRLVHSNAKGEYYDEAWESLLRESGYLR